MVQRARRTAVSSGERPTGAAPGCDVAGWLDGVSVTEVSAEKLRLTTL